MPRETFVMGQPHQILAEGRDAEMFCVHVARAYGVDGVQVRDFGGIVDTRLPGLLDDTRSDDYFPLVKSVIIARDAEKDYESAFRSAQGYLKRSGFTVPTRPYELCGDTPKVAVVIFAATHNGEAGSTGGTLEHMCLASVEAAPLLGCVDTFLECARQRETTARPHKARLYAYLAGKSDHAGMLLAPAAKANVWNFRHQCFDPLRKLFEAVNSL